MLMLSAERYHKVLTLKELALVFVILSPRTKLTASIKLDLPKKSTYSILNKYQ